MSAEVLGRRAVVAQWRLATSWIMTHIGRRNIRIGVGVRDVDAAGHGGVTHRERTEVVVAIVFLFDHVAVEV